MYSRRGPDGIQCILLLYYPVYIGGRFFDVCPARDFLLSHQ